MSAPILRIAIPSPLRRLFDYLPPPQMSAPAIPGQRYLLPFGRSTTVGILVDVASESALAMEKLRPALRQLDAEPVFDPALLGLLRWCSDYYHHPPGEVFAAALPVLLRQDRPATVNGILRWQASEAGRQQELATLARAPKQQALLRQLQQHGPLDASQLNQALDGWRAPMKRLLELGLVLEESSPCLPAYSGPRDRPPALNPAQQAAVDAILASQGEYAALLLEGVTGSGKTEVYLHGIAALLAAGRQVLVLVPEIGLTPQLYQRFAERFDCPIALLHSGLNDQERLCAWSMARSGEAGIVIGTRSAIFTPLPRLGLIIVDEEHDASFKQQEGFRYSGRDLAVVRARRENLPVVLGSATPSLESLANQQGGRYQRLHLPDRAGGASAPALRLLDVRSQRMDEGLSAPLQSAMRHHLSQGGQVLLFLNRRGFAPTLLCHECGWVSHCQRCDAHLTYYARSTRMRCHHCGSEQRVPAQCPDCGSPDLRPLGQGTERLEQALQRDFAEFGIVRIDRDSTRRKGAMDGILEGIHDKQHRILVGTQMLAKGHHFPNVSLVGIIDADQGLFSQDFRASERMAQLIVQVAGRAGRAERPGEVLIQTHAPDHPLLRRLVEQDYRAFAEAALAERHEAAMPPYSHLALLRAEAVALLQPMDFLQEVAGLARALGIPGVHILGPVPALMERRAGRYRAQLLFQAEQRAPLHQLLQQLMSQLETLKSARKTRWSLDVDPVELY
ncbi:MAG: primosomal protein N', partial [Thiohalomonadaceae bacterium]